MGINPSWRNQLGSAIRRERQRLGWTQERLAAEVTARTSVPTYSTTMTKVEAGQRDMRVEELVACADAFGLSVDALLGRKGTVDVVWAAAKLTSNAQKMIGELVTIQGRLEDDVNDLMQHAERESRMEAVAGLAGRARQVHTAIEILKANMGSLVDEFPIPGLKLDGK